MSVTALTFVAPVDPARRSALQRELARVRGAWGAPDGSPLRDVPRLHFASLTLFDAPDQDDPALAFAADLPALLVLEHDFDGPLDSSLRALLAAVGPDVHALLRCCADYGVRDAGDVAGVAAYLRAHAVRPSLHHVGNPGRDRERILRERRLRDELAPRVRARIAARADPPPTPAEVHAIAREEMRAAGGYEWVDRPHPRRTLDEWLAPRARLAAVVAGVLLLLLLVPRTTLLAVALYLVALRRQERRDRPLPPDALDLARVQDLAAREDHHAQNHLASLTVVKPGRLRRVTLRAVLLAADLRVRLGASGALGGITSIHCAQWALLDGGRRLLFLSNYDGSWGSYLDDFIDRAAPGLTAVWSNTVGFPATRFLVLDGAADGVAFKAFARMRQTAADVWYSAYPDLTVQQIDANSALRDGLAARPRGEAALRAWARLW